MSPRLINPRTTSDRVTAPVTRSPAFATARISTPRPRAAIETVVSRLATTAVGCKTGFWDQSSRSNAGDDEKTDDEPRHELVECRLSGLRTVARRHLRRRLVRFIAQFGSQNRHQQHDRAEHQDTHQLDDRSHLVAESADRQRCGEDLRHGVDGQSGHDAILRQRHLQERHEQRQDKHHDHAKHGGEGDGRGHVLSVGADDRSDGCDCGIAADRVAASDKDRHSRP